MKEQTTPAAPLASAELKQTAIVTINKFLEYRKGTDTMEAVVNFLEGFEQNDFSNLMDATLFIEHLMAFFLNPEILTRFTEKYALDNYQLSELLPNLLFLFQQLDENISRAHLNREWLTEFSGNATEKKVAGIVREYTNEIKSWEAVNLAA